MGGRQLPKPHTLTPRTHCMHSAARARPALHTAPVHALHMLCVQHTLQMLCTAHTGCMAPGHALPALYMLRPPHCTHCAACTGRTPRAHALSTLQRRQTPGTCCTRWVRCTCYTHRHCTCCTPARTVCTALHGVCCMLCTRLHCTHCVHRTQRHRMHCADTAHTLYTLRAHSYCAQIHAVPTHCACPAHIVRTAPLAHRLSCARCTRTAHTAHIRCALHAAGADIALCTLHAPHTDTAPWALRAASALHTLHAVAMRHKPPCTRTPSPAHAHPHCARASRIPPCAQFPCTRGLLRPAVRTPARTLSTPRLPARAGRALRTSLYAHRHAPAADALLAPTLPAARTGAHRARRAQTSHTCIP